MTEPAATPRRRLRVVLWGTCDMGKPRVRLLRDGLLANDVELIECRADVWTGIEDKSQVKGAGRWLKLLGSILLAYPRLAWRYLRLPRHDWVLLGYPAIPDVFVIRLFAWLRGARVSMDWFLSAYDTVVLDRALVGPRHPLAWLLWSVEWIAVRLADRVFMDTQAHARRMEAVFGLAAGRCGAVWVGAETAVFPNTPCTAAGRRPGDPLQVLFYGQFIPLHGLETIVAAARLLRDQPIDWLLIGKGQDAPRIRALLEADPLPRVRRLDWVDYASLVAYIEQSDVCLGIFGASAKAASVIPNKVFQVVAAGRPLVTRDSSAIRELLSPLDGCAYLVPPADPDALAAALLAHRSALDAHGPRPCHAAIGADITATAVGRQLVDLLQSSEA